MNIIEKFLYAIIIFFPSVLLWIYINKVDKDKEPKKVLIKLFLGGVLAGFITILVSLLIDLIIPGFVNYETKNYIKLFAYIFFGIALIEELSKFMTMRFFGWKDGNLNSTYDIILYSMLIALGFATFENILYAINGNFASAILRAFTAVPGHVIDGAFMGYFLCESKLAEISGNRKVKNKNMFMAIMIPTIIHTIYDYLAYTSHNLIIIMIFIVFVIIEYIIAIKLIKKMSKNSRLLEVPKNYCSKCGSMINANFCSHCGNPSEYQKNIDFY